MTVGIAILNWNNTPDTLACIDSVIDLQNRDFILYVVDNGSTDGSAALIEAHSRAVAARYKSRFLADTGLTSTDPPLGRPGDVVLLRNATNRGYAGGNNVAIRRAMADGCSGIWLLNNDTRVAPDALDHLLAAATPSSGVVGMCILEEMDGDQVQCLGGGRYSWWTTRTRLNGAGLPYSRRAEALGHPLDFVSGASMYIPRETIDIVGYLDERYFLYFEDVDYSVRCRAAGRPLLVAGDGRVWHGFGATTGASRAYRDRSASSAFLAARSALLLTRRHRPALLPIAAFMRIGFALSLLLRGQPLLARGVLRGTASGLVGRRLGIRPDDEARSGRGGARKGAS